MDVAGFHIEPTNICTLKCSGCARTEFINQWPQHWKNKNLDIETTMNFLDLDLTDRSIEFCGNYGDPIYHPDFIDFVKRFKERNAIITITTNGSYKNKSWWQDLTSVLTEKDRIRFSVDGTPENFTQYRINADWASIQVGIEVAAAAPVQTTWKYIPFAFNENDVDTARDLSKAMNVDNFEVDPSDRFNQVPKTLYPQKEIYVIDRTDLYKAFENTSTQKVNPQCHNHRSHFISADGYYSPCCFIADHRFYYKTQFGKNKKEYCIADTTISQLLTRPTVVDFYQNIQEHAECQFSCPG
jgi:MoaA/NifB/PqqE/SkfB family radical SAM enzyme